MVVKTQDVRTPCYSDIYNIINNYTNTYYLYTLLFAKLYAENVINKAFHKHGVASFTGAWIETFYRINIAIDGVVASFTGAWIETTNVVESNTRKEVASFTGAWIETCRCIISIGIIGRILYGCVD